MADPARIFVQVGGITIEVAGSEQFVQSRFEGLFRDLVQGDRPALGSNRPPRQEVDSKSNGEGLPYGNSPVVGSLLRRSGLSLSAVLGMIDPATGKVISGNLSQTSFHRHGQIAALIAVGHLLTEGSLVVPRDELKNELVSFGVYDYDSSSTYVRRTMQGNSAAFTKTASGWRVTLPGEEYVVSVLRELAPGDPDQDHGRGPGGGDRVQAKVSANE
jgi:hypothetical protein